MSEIIFKADLETILFQPDGNSQKLRFSPQEFRYQIRQCEINAKAERFLCNEQAESQYLWIRDQLEAALLELEKVQKPKPLPGRIIFAEIKAHIDVVELISSHVDLKNAGRTFKGLCPFHQEKSPSFTVYPETQSWYCFSCNRGGDAFDFIKLIHNVDFKDALRILSEKMA